MTGLTSPVVYAIDQDLEAKGIVQFKHAIPFSDVTSKTSEELAQYLATGATLEFGHSLEEQIGGQTEAGLAITGFYEDDWAIERTPLSKFMKPFMATRAVKKKA